MRRTDGKRSEAGDGRLVGPRDEEMACLLASLHLHKKHLRPAKEAAQE